MKHDKIILGIDPGTKTLGYGIIHVKGKEVALLTIGVIELSKYSNHFVKLKKIFERVLVLIDEFHPDELAIEAPFYGRNIQSMLKLGRAQGAAIAAALFRSVPIFEYAPTKIKLAITGNGRASKEQVAGMLQNILNIKEKPECFDATDGLAAAVCHYFQKENPPTRKQCTTWEDFIKKNPDRI
ncbi:MAG: crossover junction endodeoxyribonuclease RuvC [Bacteroidia bacterium]|nr:crossover junction endodeoxyribonuclease RuvC [Bacteroidia bacterium]